jgi:putative ABC transport system permease protein
MNLVESFRVALRALRANKFRAALTMLGVIIGVASVILLTAIGNGVKNDFVDQIEGMGSNLLYVFPAEGVGPTVGPKQFKMADRDYLAQRLPEATVVGMTEVPVTVKAGNHTMRPLATASDDGEHTVYKTEIELGRNFRQAEVTNAARVAAIGPKVAEELFPGVSNPVGKSFSMNGQRLTVIGVMKKRGASITGDKDSVVHLPLSTAMRILGTNDIQMLTAKVEDPKDLDRVSMRIKHLLRPRFGPDLSVYSQKETVGVMDKMLGTLTVMLTGIAAISLLVGGIGIMNIMLVSVSERTREIGIRKAVGARTLDVLAQFVMEAIMLSGAGGLIGIAVGAGGAWALHALVPTTIDPWSAVMAFAFSAAIGVFFGVYPAAKAARLDPIMALRHE